MRKPITNQLRAFVPSPPHLCRIIIAIVACTLMAGCAAKQASASAPNTPASAPLGRQYIEGETLRYHMTGINQRREHTLNYAAEAEARVLRDEQGRFIEEFRWTKLTVAGQEILLDQASANFRQRLSLDPRIDMTPPDIAGINPMLIGPVFDLMTFYVDLHPSLHQDRLRAPGDRVRIAHGQPNSWADGTQVILGEDCIDFELALQSVDDASAALNVRHVPPAQASIRLPAAWMHERIHPDAPNNWVQVQRDASATPPAFVAAAGHEIFDVLITIDRPSGRILHATMDNPVDIIQRRCTDEALLNCGEPVKYQIQRTIELKLVP